MTSLPPFVTPADLAEHFCAPERTVRELLREHGTYRKIGKSIILLDSDVQDFLEAIKATPPTALMRTVRRKNTTTNVKSLEEAWAKLGKKPRT